MSCFTDLLSELLVYWADHFTAGMTFWVEKSPRIQNFTTCMNRWSDHFTVCMTCCLLVGCLTSQQHASVSQGPIFSDNFTCCHTEIEVADQTFHLAQSQYTDTGPTSPSTDPITPGAWQGSYWSVNF